MDWLRALQRAVHSWAPGTEALAAALGIARSSLYHKVDPRCPGARPSVEESLQICELTGDMGWLHAVAARLNHSAVPLPAYEPGGREGVREMATAVREFGELAVEAATALADGAVTENELARVEREGLQAIYAITRLMESARHLHEAARPRE